MSEWTYLWVNFAVISIPFAASFDKRVAFVEQWKHFWPACLLTMAGFVAWDIVFTAQGIWGFNEAHLSGLGLWGLPLEEWLFFITIPYACIFTYACFKKYFPWHPFGFGHRAITTAVCALCVGLAFRFWDHAYLGLTSALCALWLIGVLAKWRPWMGHFWFAYIVLLVPFILSNGVLTGIEFWKYPMLHNHPEAIADHIVWYNNDHNSGWRIFSMPADDLLYGLLLIGMNVSLYEVFASRGKNLGSAMV